MISVSCSGSSKITTIPTDASAWQIAMVGTLPSQLAIHPQASLPAAPPTNTSVKANPAVVTAAPFPISRNGRHTKKLLRTTLSVMPSSKNAKAEALRGRTYTVLAEDKLRRRQSRLRRDPRGQNGNHNRHDDADEP